MMTFKTIYQRMSLRERLLLIAFLWVVLIAALTSLFDWTSRNRVEWSDLSLLLKTQNELFEQRPVVEAELEEMRRRFNRDNTFSDSKLNEKVDELARSVDLVFINSGIVKPERGPTVNLYTLTGSVKRKEIGQILELEALLRKEYPYITVDSLKLTADPGNPQFLTARFVIKSFELK